ncbi:MAG: MFS transporter [Alphaproteobacteria bacterium]|nr:MFS transporter [Alphaproteobacteria bacterium]
MTTGARSWRRPEILLILMAAAVPLSHASWQALLNNFAVEQAAFTGAEMGILQSVREIPGFLAFAVVFVLWLMREQTLAIVALLLLGIGTAVTGFFPTVVGLCLTTFIMSMGFHYYETVQQSLTLQWIDKKRAPLVFGRIIAIGSFAGIVSLVLIYIAFDQLGMDFRWVYLVAGGGTVVIAVVARFAFPRFEQPVEQHKHMVIRRRYWLYYALTFLSGARRQIFIVFAGFMMVEKFGYSVAEMSIMFLITGVLNMFLAPRIGRLISRWGERRALIVEYIGLIVIFVSYAFVEDATFGAGLYIVDHVFFALAIAIKTYFQKIADPADIAPTAGVSFTISHIAAVVIPAIFGFVWLVSPAAVFMSGAGIAVLSLVLSMNVPHNPQDGNEVLYRRRPRPLRSPLPAE